MGGRSKANLKQALKENEMNNKTPKFLNSVTEHPDVQRLIKQVIRGDAKNKQLQADNERLKEELIETNIEIVQQSCAGRDGKLDSMAISTYAAAMRFLAVEGKVIIEEEFGRRVIGRWANKP